MEKLKVKMLKKGDTIGFICPSSKNKQSERVPKLVEYITSLGLKIKFGKTCLLEDGYLAGTDEQRVKDLEDMFLDKEVNAIICFKGGYGASRILDKIDYNIIKTNPKLFMGFSDITALDNAIYQITSLPTVHGQVGIFIASNYCDDLSRKDFKEFLFTKTKGRVLTDPNIKVLVEGRVEGEISGGNLCLISDLIKTPYEVSFKDKIVLIEEVEEPPYNIDRMFAQLRLSGLLNEAKGFIFGHFTDCKEDEGCQTYLSLIEEYIKPLNKPTIIGFPTGHSFPFLNVPIGLKVELDATNKKITILEELYAKD